MSMLVSCLPCLIFFTLTDANLPLSDKNMAEKNSNFVRDLSNRGKKVKNWLSDPIAIDILTLFRHLDMNGGDWTPSPPFPLHTTSNWRMKMTLFSGLLFWQELVGTTHRPLNGTTWQRLWLWLWWAVGGGQWVVGSGWCALGSSTNANINYKQLQ